MYLWMTRFFKLCDRCSLYNYADDNTMSVSHSDTDELKRQLQKCSEMAIQWLESNQMQVNPYKNSAYDHVFRVEARADRADHL